MRALAQCSTRMWCPAPGGGRWRRRRRRRCPGPRCAGPRPPRSRRRPPDRPRPRGRCWGRRRCRRRRRPRGGGCRPPAVPRRPCRGRRCHHPLGRHGRLRPHEQRPLLRADRHRDRLHLQDAIGGAVDSLDRSGCSPRSAAASSAEVGYPAPIDLGSSSTASVARRSSTAWASSRATVTMRPPRAARSWSTSTTPTPRARPRRCPTSYDVPPRPCELTPWFPRPTRRRLPRPAARLAARDAATGARGAAPRRSRDDRDDQAVGPALLRPRGQRRGVPGGARPRQRLRLRRRVVPTPTAWSPPGRTTRRPGRSRSARATTSPRGRCWGSSGAWSPTTGPAAGAG